MEPNKFEDECRGAHRHTHTHTHSHTHTHTHTLTHTHTRTHTHTHTHTHSGLFGALAFSLYTLDKLVSQVVHQVQSVLKNEVCMQLLSLFQYEKGRQAMRAQASDDKELSAEVARAYFADAMHLMSGEEPLCQVQLFILRFIIKHAM
jgi:ABC-type Zn2+ transport system substrate-binding protein/surface adhesin